MFASLPMYDRPENQGAHDVLWALIRDGLRNRGIAAPDTLDRTTHHMDGWARADLVIGQICNLPYRAAFRGRVTLIGAADYGVPDAAPGYYYSVFMVRDDDPAKTVDDALGYPFAFNEPLSNSGWGMPQQYAMSLGASLHPTLRTGSHLQSLLAVITGRAGLAALDVVTFRNMLRWEPLARQVRVIGITAPMPGMTFITRAMQDPAPYHAALAAAIAALPPETASVLGLQRIVILSQDAYDLPLPPPPGAVPEVDVA